MKISFECINVGAPLQYTYTCDLDIRLKVFNHTVKKHYTKLLIFSHLIQANYNHGRENKNLYRTAMSYAVSLASQRHILLGEEMFVNSEVSSES